LKLKLVFGAAVAVAAATLAVAFVNDDVFQGVIVKQPYDAVKHGKGGGKPGTTQILYHNGPVMHKGTVYLIYYGNVAANTQTIINNFLSDVNGSAPWSVNGTYYDLAPQPSPGPVQSTYNFTMPSGVVNSHGWDGSVFYDNYSQGSSLGTSSTQKIVAHALSTVSPDPSGVYIVITSPDVKVSGFCTSFCAYHSSSSTIANGFKIRYALVPDPTQKCSGCNGGIAVYGDKVTPNGDMGADTITDDIMHELSETVSDPDINAWYTSGGSENGDLCNYVYSGSGATVQTGTDVQGNTFHYNFSNGNRKYLIQLIWKNTLAGFCSAQ
jgi:hypothetical protein